LPLKDEIQRHPPPTPEKPTPQKDHHVLAKLRHQNLESDLELNFMMDLTTKVSEYSTKRSLASIYKKGAH
jgi:hypothetical protein